MAQCPIRPVVRGAEPHEFTRGRNADRERRNHRALIDLRGTEDVLVYGSYAPLVQDENRIYAYTRTLAEERVLIVLNWSAEPTRFDPEALETIETDTATVLLDNDGDTPTDPRERRFRPYEAAVYRLYPYSTPAICIAGESL